MPVPAAANRRQVISALGETVFDVLVVGGGIVGSGIARDAAMRGLKVGLVEQHDFAFGTSSRSSRLLHGGMRYLAQGRVGLVHEASVEKKIIHRIAPHLAEPLPFLFPTYANNKEWKLWQLKIGVKIYDLLCGGRNLGQSSWLSRESTERAAPGLTTDGLQGAVRYFDGFTNDARLTIDTMRSAAEAGAHLLNYARMSRAERAEIWQCAIEDQHGGIAFEVRARNVVAATGPWAETLPQSSVKLRVTKGIHVVVDRSRIAVADTVVMTEGKRILFAIPWGERTILGTTDTDYEGPLDDVRASADDIEYVLTVVNRFFPSTKLTTADVISTWAGLRPLLADPHGNPSDISRSHEIRHPHPGWWDVAGGKLTTYRLIAEQTVDRVIRADETLTARQPCRTANEPLLPAHETDGVSGILPPAFARDTVEHYCANEWAMHLDDVMIRRTSWAHYFPDRQERAHQVAAWMSQMLGWDDATRTAELSRYNALSVDRRATQSIIAVA